MEELNIEEQYDEEVSSEDAIQDQKVRLAQSSISNSSLRVSAE